MSKYHRVNAYLKNSGDDDELYHYALSVCRDKGYSMTDLVRDAFKIYREYQKRGGFVEPADVEDRLMWRIEEYLRDKFVVSPPMDDAITEETEDIDDVPVFDFDPAKYGIYEN